MLNELNKNNHISEGKINRLAIRTIIFDIVKLIKNSSEGNIHLPDNNDLDSVYEFTNTNLTFPIELELNTNELVGGFYVDGDYSSDDDTITLVIEYNPKTIGKQLYDLIGELNEVLAHEMEHLNQEYRGDFELGNEPPKNPLKYYTQKHEIPAQYKGFKRLSKLRKLPLEVVVRDWFDTHKEIHQLKPKDVDVVINQILQYKK